jgi:hypothetical protein
MDPNSVESQVVFTREQLEHELDLNSQLKACYKSLHSNTNYALYDANKQPFYSGKTTDLPTRIKQLIIGALHPGLVRIDITLLIFLFRFTINPCTT